jgi:hypothetical protein
LSSTTLPAADAAPADSLAIIGDECCSSFSLAAI